ncbi:MAG: hypothetical protein ABI321_00800 [Polyangia bacterium]
MRQLVIASLLLAAPVIAVAAPADVAPSEARATGWKVRAVAPHGAQVGKRAELEIFVEAESGYHLNDDYPINFKPTGTKAARFDAPRIEKSAAVLSACPTDATHKCGARMPVAFVATAAGSAQLGGTLAFSACNDAQCLIQKVVVSTPVSIER